jgi:hypothetical protein
MHSLNGPRSAFGVRRATDINLSLAYFRSYFCTLQKVYQKSRDLSYLELLATAHLFSDANQMLRS